MMVKNRHEEIRQDPCRLLFATSDESMLVDIGKELAPAFFVSIASDIGALFRSLEEHAPEVVAIDLDTIVPTGQEAFAQIESIRAQSQRTVLLVISRGLLRNDERARRAGADQVLVGPVDFPALRRILLETLAERRGEAQGMRLRDLVDRRTSFYGMIGGCEPMRRVYDALRRIGPSNTTVMIRGESGTGKELAARALVSLSPRRDRPFISLNCAALPETLMESELFGHERGAFTGAHAPRPGQIELADGGTLFLDEIGSLGLALQSKLLRVLQDRAVQRIGAKHPRTIDFRLITATNDNLEEMVKKGQFREDLYYRISVIPVTLPPLRERVGDVPLLLDHYLKMYCTANNVESKRVSPEAMEVLETATWPGNVRELENLAQRMVLMVDGDVVGVEHLPEKVMLNSTISRDQMLIPPEGVDLDDEMVRVEVAFLQAALRRAGTKNGAAALLRIPVQKMKYLCRKHGLAAPGENLTPGG